MQSFLTTPLPPVAYDLLALLIILFFAWRGKRRGFAREMASMISIVGSILLAKPLGGLLIHVFTNATLPGFIATPIELTLGGVAAYLFFRVTLFLILRFSGLLKEREDGHVKSWLEAGGALIGSLFGAFIVLAFGWYILSFGTVGAILMQNSRLQTALAAQTSDPLPPQVRLLFLPTQMTAAHRAPFAMSISGKISNHFNPIPTKIIESAEVVIKVTQNPEEIQKLAEFAQVQALMEQPSIKALVGNEEVKALAEKGDIQGLLNHSDIQALLNDPEIQEILKNMDPEEIKVFLEQQK